MEAPVIEPIGKETPEEARNVRELEGILQHAAEGPKKSITTVVKGATLQEALVMAAMARELIRKTRRRWRNEKKNSH